MKNPNEMNINEIKSELLEIFDEETTEEMLELYSIEELVDIIEKEKESIIDNESIEPSKHCPSRKKEANRTKKETTTYKKAKGKKWIENTRTNIPDEETSSRSYLNKASKGYNKLRPHIKPKAKKENKNS